MFAVGTLTEPVRVAREGKDEVGRTLVVVVVGAEADRAATAAETGSVRLASPVAVVDVGTERPIGALRVEPLLVLGGLSDLMSGRGRARVAVGAVVDEVDDAAELGRPSDESEVLVPDRMEEVMVDRAGAREGRVEVVPAGRTSREGALTGLVVEERGLAREAAGGGRTVEDEEGAAEELEGGLGNPVARNAGAEGGEARLGSADRGIPPSRRCPGRADDGTTLLRHFLLSSREDEVEDGGLREVDDFEESFVS